MKKIGIIGSGISGLTCAWYLKDDCEVYLFEKEDYAGGHTNTITVQESDKWIPIDTGFMVFNEQTYPNLIRLFDDLNVSSYDTSMSFGVNNLNTNWYYSSNGLNGFFANRWDFFKARQWKLLKEMKRFFRIANDLLKSSHSSTQSIGDFLIQKNFTESFGKNFLYPMASAIWSTHNRHIEDYPAYSLIKFLGNHGLLGIGTQFQWKTVQNGSQTYRDKILEQLPHKIQLSSPITNIQEKTDQVVIHDQNNNSYDFDHVVIATHADQALRLLQNPTFTQIRLLSPFQYTKNKAVLHSDCSVMPRSKAAWASWNYSYEKKDSKVSASTHYWMNNLQDLQSKQNYFVSIDFDGPINPGKIHWQKTYEHPCYDEKTLEAQKHLHLLNENTRTHFCGSYFGYGFHEDAHISALKIVKKFKKMKGSDHEILPV